MKSGVTVGILRKFGGIMTSEERNERRELVFRVHDVETREVIVREPFASAASDAEIGEFVRGSIKRLNEIRAFIKSVPKAKGILSETQTVSLYMYERESGAQREVITLQVREDQRATLDAVCAAMVSNMEAVIGANIGITYSMMVAKIEREGWDVYKMKDVQWRELCLLHPLYLYHWDMKQKAEFEKRAKDSILSGLRAGTYELKGFKRKRPVSSGETKKTGAKSKKIRMKRASSVTGTDEARFIRKRK